MKQSSHHEFKPCTRRKGLRRHGAGWQARLRVNGVTESKTFPSRAEAELWLGIKRGELLADAGMEGQDGVDHSGFPQLARRIYNGCNTVN